MADTLTPEEKNRLTQELTKYANEGASDDDLRQFRDAFISELKKKGGGQPASGAPQGQPGKPSAPSFGQKVTEKITNSSTQVPFKTAEQDKQPVQEKKKAAPSKYFEVDVTEPQDVTTVKPAVSPVEMEKRESISMATPQKIAERENKQKADNDFYTKVASKEVFKMPTYFESKEYTSDITSDYLDYLQRVDPEKSTYTNEKYKVLKAKSKEERTATDEGFLREVESEAINKVYDANYERLQLLGSNIDNLEKISVTPSDRSKLDYMYKEYEKISNSLQGLSATYNQNNLQYGKIAGQEMQSEEDKRKRFEAIQAGEGKTKEFFTAVGDAAMDGILNMYQFPKVMGDLMGDKDYDWSDEFYDNISGAKSALDVDLGAPLPQGAKMSDLPLAARAAVVGGNAIGTMGIFMLGGATGGATKLGQRAATFATSFLTQESNYYQEALDGGMSPQDAAITGTYLAAQMALFETIIPDVGYLNAVGFKKGVVSGAMQAMKSGLPAKEAAKLALKNALSALPENALTVGKNVLKSGGKEFFAEELPQNLAEDTAKEIINNRSQKEYFNNTFNVDNYVDAAIGSFIAAGGISGASSIFSKATPKSPVQAEVMREIVERRPHEKMKGTASDKINKVDLSNIEEAVIIYESMSSHSGWNVMSREEQNHALALAQQAQVMKKEQERMKELRIPDERKDAEIKKLEDEVNQMFSMQMEQDKQKAKDAKLKAIEDDFNKSMEGEEFPVQEDERDQEIVELQKQREEKGVNELDTFLGDMKPMVPFAVERTEQGLPVAQSVKQAASNYLYKKYKELTDMKSDPNRMMTRGQIASVQKQLEQDIRTLEGTAETKTEARDQENIQGVPGEVGEGKKPVATQPVESPSTEAVETGGVLQAPKEEVAPSLSVGSKIQWNVFGNEESGEWIVGEKTKTRGGKDAVVLSKTYVESSQDGKNYTKEYADANGIKYDNERIVEHIVPISELQAQEEVTPTTEAAPKAAPAPKPSLGQRLRTAAEAAETTVTVQEPAPVKEEKEEGVAPAPKKEKKPTKTKAKAPEIAPAPRRANAVEASEGDNPIAGAENTLAAVGMNETSLNEWKKANEKDSKKGRIEELAELVRNLMSGKIKFKDYYERAKQIMPSKLMDKVPAVTSFKEIVGSIDRNKLEKGVINLNKFIKKGTRVGLRIDIPAFNRFGKNVVTVHEGTGKRSTIGYGSTGSIQNVNFRTSVSTAAKIGAGEDKSAFAMAIGEWMDESPESIQARAEEALNSPEWIQVSMNPTRSSFFFDKADGNPVVAADEVLQVGNLVLAKNAQKIDLNTKEGMTQFEKMFSAKTKEGVTFQYRRGTSLGQRLRATFDTAGERAAEDIARFLEESGIDVQIIDSVEAERIGQERNIEGSIDGIFFADKDSGIIYLNKDSIKGKDGATIAYHEGIHPVINIIRNTNPELYGAIVAGIREEAKRNPAVARVIRQIESVKEYQKRGPEAIEDEIVVETLAQIASGGINLNELDKTLKQKMIEFFNKLVERMPKLASAFNLKPIKVDATSQELLDFSKKLSAALTEGGRISDVVGAENVMEFAPPVSLSITDDAAQELIVPGSQILGTPSIGQASIADSRIEDFDTKPYKAKGVPMKYSKPRTMEDVLSDSGGAAVFVNSDGTKVGVVTINGKKYTIQGGLDYTFIKKNVDDNVGFAASENQKISTLNSIAKGIAEMRDQKNPRHKGKPVAVFVVSQNGEAMLGEWYAGEYIMEGIDKALSEGTYEGGIGAAREQFSKAIKDVVIKTKTEDGKKDNKARNTLVEMIESNLFDTHKGRMKIADFLSSKEVSFGLRSKINGEILAANPKLSGRGKNRQLKKALADAGHHMEDFWKLFADERFLPAIEKERLVPEKGKVFANKTFSGFYYDPFVSIEKQIEHTQKGLQHRQFNSKFMSVGDPFLLTQAHDINKLFPDMGYADSDGYEIYNKANKTDIGKKSSIGDRIKVSEWLNKNGYNKNVINPYSSISLSIYTGYVTDEYKAPGAKIPSSKIKGQASLIDRSKEGGLRPSSEGLKIVNGWYSPIEKRLRETKADKQSAQKWLTSGIIGKGDEAIYTGVKGWLESKKPTDQVSKQEIIDWMDNNRVEIQEVSKSDEPKMSDAEARNVFENQGYDVVTDSNGDTYVEKDEELYDYEDMSPLERDAFDVLTMKNLDTGRQKQTKYQTFQLKGEKSNYKELLVTLPSKSSQDYKIVKGKDGKYRIKNPDGSINQGRYWSVRSAAESALVGDIKRAKTTFQSTHFEEPNILVHLRMNTRTDADGNKVLLLEELQSDWGQKGKREGFAINVKELPSNYKIKKIPTYGSILGDYRFEVIDRGELIASGYTEAEAKENALEWLNKKGTPTAPFVTDTNAWTKLGLKMALREAVKQGADKVAWTTGEQQNQRYDLSKQVDSINYLKNGDGTYQVYAKKNGDIIFKEKALEENKLEGAFGKDVAERIINDRGKSEEGLATKVLSGNDLSVGGKGMKGYYDNIVPNVAQALVKELTGETGAIGTTVLGEKTELTKNAVIEENRNGLFNIYDREKSPVPIFKNIETKEQAEEILNNPVKNASTQQSIEITPELKAAVQGGMPQFSLIDRSGNDIGPLIEEAADAVEQAIASGTTPQKALDEFIGSQEWYSDLTPGQRKQIDDILQEEFGTTPKVSVKKPTGIKATISNIIDNYYKLKDGDRSARDAINQILDTDPKLKYIYDNISRINKQLQDAGVITDKTDGCP